MTPAVNVAKKAKITFNLHEYEHDPSAQSYGEEAAEALGLPMGRVFKTLLVAQEGDQKRLAVAVVPVDAQLDLKALAAALSVKKVAMAQADAAQRITGYVLGGISPLGQKKRLPTVLSDSAQSYETLFVSAGRRGLEIELTPADLVALTAAKVANIARY
ncbi:Cys-tRNA(Pro) deacylase [Neptunomonas marina]|uniref:Cys-tRNA(Pro)/Cys-tRNA(Cys) deacylase n=1 Tax=Neptunomonas marina TaxID=1815562 RepID=A0A437QDI8_9GAMM|nr:Cys-tRNA(Pro) deacylase [Neptunomonas marina]RVU32453.1 Cys-tRNA(Pro) deacylase [Neptunomonas marina]